MKIVLLNGRGLDHGQLAEKFGFPDYYGHNLDALYDCLTDITSDTAVIVWRSDLADPRILRVLRDSARENPPRRIYG